MKVDWCTLRWTYDEYMTNLLERLTDENTVGDRCYSLESLYLDVIDWIGLVRTIMITSREKRRRIHNRIVDLATMILKYSKKEVHASLDRFFGTSPTNSVVMSMTALGPDNRPYGTYLDPLEPSRISRQSDPRKSSEYYIKKKMWDDMSLKEIDEILDARRR